MQFLRYLFTPHHTNNFRPKVLHNTSLLILALVVFALSGATYFVKTTHPAVLGISYSISEVELLNDTNQARQASGQAVLAMNSALADAARRKAADMFQKDYWAHFAPDGTSPWSFITAAGYNYTYAGENLAKGYTSSQDVVNAWMNSPSHKENLLSSKYKDVGFAVVEGKLQGEDTVLVVQMFGVQPGVVTQSAPPPSVQKVASAPEKPVVINVPAAKEVSGSQVLPKPIVNAPAATKYVSVSLLVFIIAILLLDFIVVEKRKIPRIMGHNLDHIILLLLFLLFILLETNHGIL
ncbi:MAG: CAP domain-containing protein [Candidatus Levyibacteriota bacterium]